MCATQFWLVCEQRKPCSRRLLRLFCTPLPPVQWEPKLGLAGCPDKIETYNRIRKRQPSEPTDLSKSAGAALPPPPKTLPNGPAQLWSTDEDSVLMQAQSVFGNDWDAIAERVGRSERAVESRWNRISWTLAEDYAIIRAHATVGTAWTASIPGRSPDAVETRWNAVLSKRQPSRPMAKAGGGGSEGGEGGGHSTPSQPSSRQGKSWTPEEDRALAEAYGELGAVWEAIAARLSGRSTRAVRSRWAHILSKQQPAPFARGPTPSPVRGATTRRQWQGALVEDADADGGAAARQRPAASETTRPSTIVVSIRGNGLRVANRPRAQLAASPGPAGTRATSPAATPVQREAASTPTTACAKGTALAEATGAATAAVGVTPPGLGVAYGKSGSAARQSAYTGVTWNANSNKWIVNITHRGVNRYIGSTHNEHEGARWFDAACKVPGCTCWLYARRVPTRRYANPVPIFCRRYIHNMPNFCRSCAR